MFLAMYSFMLLSVLLYHYYYVGWVGSLPQLIRSVLSNGSVQGVIVADKLNDSRRDGHMAERLRPTPPGTQSCPESDIQGHKQLRNTSEKDCAVGVVPGLLLLLPSYQCVKLNQTARNHKRNQWLFWKSMPFLSSYLLLFCLFVFNSKLGSITFGWAYIFSVFWH